MRKFHRKRRFGYGKKSFKRRPGRRSRSRRIRSYSNSRGGVRL